LSIAPSFHTTPNAELYPGSFLPLVSQYHTGEKAPSITLSQLRALLKAVLAMRVFDIQALLDLVAWI
jgi:hypothetical protein